MMPVINVLKTGKNERHERGMLDWEHLRKIRAMKKHPRNKGMMKNDSQLAILFTLVTLFKVNLVLRRQPEST